MPKYLSGRAKRVPQDQLSEDRYRYLGLDQAEPNLSDPLVSPSAPTGAQYQLVAVPGFPGKRYWVPVGGGLVPGAITIFDESSPVSSSSSITQLNFVGAAVTANVSVQSPSGHPGIAATVTVIPVSVTETPPNYPTPNEGELWWESDTGDLYIYYNDGDSAQWVQTNAGGRGLAGDKGQKGEIGPQGLTGNAGAKGDKGQKGQTGDVEAQGNKGQKGEIGAGQKGQKGEAGTDGTDGNKGQKGEDNTTKGQKGEQGIGQKGQKGEKGLSGGGATVTISDNAPGSPSAGDMWWDSDDFDLHVYYGDGDSNQWVSITSNAALKGQKGEKGEKGDKGQKGEKGEKGQKGELGVSGNPGSKGEKGQKGDNGEKGQKGEGDKGQKGQDGNDGTSIKGNKGEVGDKGQKGEKGEKGQKGEKGLKGEDNSTKGQKGEKGEKGQKGEIGVGIKGQKGQDGNDGTSIKGNKGEVGDKGQKGEDNSTKGQKGAPGADNSTKGDKGQKGEVGAPGADNSTKGNKGEKGQKGEDNSTKGQKGEIGTAGSTGIPSGAIMLWSGAANAIPSGWYLCDGNNSTPNLSGKFVVGYSASDSDFDVGDTGGSKDATLVSHSHTVDSHTHGDGSLTAANRSLTGSITGISESFAGFGGSASGVFSKVGGYNLGGTPGSPDNNNCGGVNFNGSHTHDVTGSTGSASPGTNSQGSSATNANLPPYYALCYIMKA